MQCSMGESALVSEPRSGERRAARGSCKLTPCRARVGQQQAYPLARGGQQQAYPLPRGGWQLHSAPLSSAPRPLATPSQGVGSLPATPRPSQRVGSLPATSSQGLNDFFLHFEPGSYL